MQLMKSVALVTTLEELPHQSQPDRSLAIFRPLPSPNSSDLYRSVKVRSLFNEADDRHNELAPEANRIDETSEAVFRQAQVSIRGLQIALREGRQRTLTHLLCL